MSLPTLQSCLYEGTVFHRRFTPFEHAFRYNLAFVYLDLDELDAAFRGRWLWSHNQPGIAWFRRADHFGDPHTPLRDAVHALLAEHGIEARGGAVRLLTQPRYFGYNLNPVSFFYCYDGSDGSLSAVIAEVHNTPWGETHCYVLPAATFIDGPEEGRITPKEFHVSPFMSLDMDYHWRLTPPADQLEVAIENHAQGAQLFEARLTLRRREWTTKNLARLLLFYPLMTQRIFLAIYWQALRLWWKRCPYVPHPGRREPLSEQLESKTTDRSPREVLLTTRDK